MRLEYGSATHPCSLAINSDFSPRAVKPFLARLAGDPNCHVAGLRCAAGPCAGYMVERAVDQWATATAPIGPGGTLPRLRQKGRQPVRC